jgi:protein-disulfide isomerase
MHKKTLIILYTILIVFLVFISFKVIENSNLITHKLSEKSYIKKENKAIPQLSIMPLGDNPKIGIDSSKVKMIVYIDYECSFCSKFIKEQLPKIKKEYINEGKLQVIFKDYPLSFHKKAIPLAQKAHVEYSNGNFEKFIVNVWDTPSEKIDINFNEKKLIKINKEITESIFLAGVAGINSTPTFIINNRILKGYRTYDDLKSLIDYNLNN